MARPKGLHLNAAAFNGVLALRLMSRSDVAEASKQKLSFISDLAAGRYGASPHTAKAISDALMVDPGVLFPELVGFTAPDRAVA